VTSSTRELVDRVPQVGRLSEILVRRSKHGEVVRVPGAEVLDGLGLAGDHRAGRRQPDPRSKRHVSLVQAEHLSVIAALVGREALDAAELRRNLVIAGINLWSLRDRTFRVGPVLLEGTGPCHPCSRMESALGPGGFQALRGHGGITARVIAGGPLTLGDAVEVTEVAGTPVRPGSSTP
jgi:MOSC domain-containing protein YiiM